MADAQTLQAQRLAAARQTTQFRGAALHPPEPWQRHDLTPAEAALLRRAAAWPDVPELPDASPAALAGLARREGVDLATAVLYDRVLRSPLHGSFIKRIDSMAARDDATVEPTGVTVAIAPGAYYEQYPRSGADGLFVRRALEPMGVRVELIGSRSVGGVRENARIILDWLRARRRSERVVLVSLSKGGADVKEALRQAAAAPEVHADRPAFAPLVAWINCCGLTSGTPVVSPFLRSRLLRGYARLVFFLRGHDFEMVRELAPGPGSLLDFAPPVPPALRVVNVVGFPLRSHLSTRLLRRLHRRLAPLGPNDGSCLLADAVRMPGVIYPVWAADHYLRPPAGIAHLVRALLAHVLQAS